MTPAVRMTMNTQDFNRVLAKVAAESERTYPQFLNGQSLRLASFALRETERADVNKIAWSLGQSDRRFTNKRTGAALKTPKRVYSSASSLNLYRIVNWRRKRAGLEPLGGQAMSAPARRMRAATLRSAGFIASGWIYAVRGLSRLAGYSDRIPTKGVKVSGQPKGYVLPARFAINSNVTCEIGNTSLLGVSAARTGLRPGRPMKIAMKGLAIAKDLTAKDMLAHLARKLQPVLNQYSAR